MQLRRLAIHLALGMLIASCSLFVPDRASPSADHVLDVASNGTADGLGRSVSDARSHVGEQVVVNGSLLIDPDGTAWLCEALGESFPPTCVGPRLRLVHLDASTRTGLSSGGGARWSDRPIQLFGTVRAGG
jgi:hypothetical protein